MHTNYKYLPDPLTLYVSISMCNVKWLCLAVLCILFGQVPHPVVSLPNDGFMEYNKWMNEWMNKILYCCVLDVYNLLL
jgi:hypothetical protein